MGRVLWCAVIHLLRRASLTSGWWFSSPVKHNAPLLLALRVCTYKLPWMPFQLVWITIQLGLRKTWLQISYGNFSMLWLKWIQGPMSLSVCSERNNSRSWNCLWLWSKWLAMVRKVWNFSPIHIRDGMKDCFIQYEMNSHVCVKKVSTL